LKRNRYSRSKQSAGWTRRVQALHLSVSHRIAERSREVAAEIRPFTGRIWLRLGLLGLLGVGAIYLCLVSVNVLVLGTDDVDYSQRTDTLILLHWQPLPRRMAVLSIPRDTLIQLPKRGPLKINAVYAYGKALNGPAYALAMTRASIENLLGARIHHLVHIRYSDFIALVDAVGGVPVYIPKRMRYTDQAGGLYIDLEPGYQLLDGRQALDYVRFRHDEEGDLGRIRRQQEFLKAFVAQMAGFSRLPRTFRAFQAFLHQVETDITLPSALFLAIEAKGIVGLNWRQAILPGQPVYLEGKSYWQTEPAAIRRMMAELGRPAKVRRTPAMKVVSTSVAVAPTPAPAAEAEAAESGTSDLMPVSTLAATRVSAREKPVAPNPAKNRAKAVSTSDAAEPRAAVKLPGGPQPVVRILNGCGVSGVCKRAAEPLTRRGVRILAKDITNAPNFNFTVTCIKTNPKHAPWARSLASILGLREDRIQVIPAKTAYPTVTVVVGQDYLEWLR